jgi:Raf kinase inhibitor-like YbhB/YbcL family protein
MAELKFEAGNTKKNMAPTNAIQSKTDFGFAGYGGPCPPERDKPHKYIVPVYALKTEKIELDSNANPARVGFYMEQYVIEKALLISYFKR